MRGHEPADELGVLVINMRNLFCTEKTWLSGWLWGWHVNWLMMGNEQLVWIKTEGLRYQSEYQEWNLQRLELAG